MMSDDLNPHGVSRAQGRVERIDVVVAATEIIVTL